jgi:hypothetical protein
MTTSDRAGAFLLFAVISGGCAAATTQSTQLRVHSATAAYEHNASAHSQIIHAPKRSGHKDSPLLRACKSGSSKSCNELGDRLTLKHAYTEARQWYLTSCERVSSSMLPSGASLMQLSQEMARLSSERSDDEQTTAANQKRLTQLNSEAGEMRARIQGCFDVGETLKLDAEVKQSLKYYETVCEFSTLVDVVGAAVPGLEYVTENGCTAGEAARLTTKTQFSPHLFVQLVQPKAKTPAAKQSPAQSADSMVFNEGDL